MLTAKPGNGEEIEVSGAVGRSWCGWRNGWGTHTL